MDLELLQKIIQMDLADDDDQIDWDELDNEKS